MKELRWIYPHPPRQRRQKDLISEKLVQGDNNALLPSLPLRLPKSFGRHTSHFIESLTRENLNKAGIAWLLPLKPRSMRRGPGVRAPAALESLT